VKTVLIMSLTGTFLAVLALVGFLLYTGRDITPLLIALPTIVAVLGTLYGVQKVQTQTNGANSELRQMNSELHAENKQLRGLLPPEQAALVPIVIPPEPVHDGDNR